MPPISRSQFRFALSGDFRYHSPQQRPADLKRGLLPQGKRSSGKKYCGDRSFFRRARLLVHQSATLGPERSQRLYEHLEALARCHREPTDRTAAELEQDQAGSRAARQRQQANPERDRRAAQACEKGAPHHFRWKVPAPIHS